MIIKNEDYEGPAVYQIVNQTNNRKYIGSTSNYRLRANTHLSDLKAGRHYNKELQEDFNNNENVFITDILKKYTFKLNHELFSKEHEFIEAAKKNGEELYNITEMRSNYYTSYQNLIFKMADLYAQEHFGIRAGQFNTMPPAKIEMYYYILDAQSPEEAQAIRDRYADAIDYQNKKDYYRIHLGLNYDELLEMPEDEKKAIIRDARQKKGYKTSKN